MLSVPLANGCGCIHGGPGNGWCVPPLIRKDNIYSMHTPVYVYLSSEPFSKIKLRPTSHFGVYRTDPIKLVVNETTVATYQYVRLDRVFNKIFIYDIHLRRDVGSLGLGEFYDEQMGGRGKLGRDE